jgi:hypothetical protein
MTKLILALRAGAALMLAAGIPAARADTSCTGIPTGRAAQLASSENAALNSASDNSTASAASIKYRSS